MRIVIILFIILVSNLVQGQEGIRISHQITLVEDYVVEDYHIPDSLLFYSGGHWELEKFYTLLYNKIEKEFKKHPSTIDFEFDKDSKMPNHVMSFEDMNIDLEQHTMYDAVCVFGMNNLGFEYPNGYIDAIVIVRVDFFMILIETKTNRILMKKKYNIGARESFYNENRRLAKDISKAIKE